MRKKKGKMRRIRSSLGSRALSSRVFLVHGRDEHNKNRLKDMLLSWGLKPIVLAEQPNRGRVLIEKLLDHTSDAGFVFVLMTPDDVGTTTREYDRLLNVVASLPVSSWFFSPLPDLTEDERQRFFSGPVNRQALRWFVDALRERIANTFKPRVRQNVMFEYGLCMGSLGRERVCIVLGGELEIPSDILGYGYIRFKDSVSECREEIVRELRAAGYDVDG